MMVFNNTTEAARIIRTFAALRKTNDALAFGDFRTIYADYNVWAFERAFGSHRHLVVLNNGPEKNLTLSLNWSDGTYRDALYGADMVVNRGKALVTLPRNSFYVFHIEDDQNEPLIGSVTPYIAQPGQKILIAGAGFGKSGTVFIGGEKARIISWNWSQILVEVPRLKTSDAWVPVYVEVDGKDSNRVKLRYYSENEIPALVVNGSNLTGGLWLDGDLPELAEPRYLIKSSTGYYFTVVPLPNGTVFSVELYRGLPWGELEPLNVTLYGKAGSTILLNSEPPVSTPTETPILTSLESPCESSSWISYAGIIAVGLTLAFLILRKGRF